MPLKVCKNHSSRTLIEIYKENANDQDGTMWQSQSENMIELINFINQHFKETNLWGLTSLMRLVLLTENDTASKWYVTIANSGTNEFYFDYSIPENESPWPNGSVTGVAQTIEEAKKFIAISMHKSSAWKGNIELEKLLLELDIAI